MKLFYLLLLLTIVVSCKKSEDTTLVTPVTPVISDSVNNGIDISWLKGKWLGTFNNTTMVLTP